MKLLPLLLAISTLASCAHLQRPGSADRERITLWEQAHNALAAADFQSAERTFSVLAQQHPDSREGRESLFYLGSMMIDPRNPGWNPAPAERNLRSYLGRETPEQPMVQRRPEATTLLHLAQQLNMPAEERVAALQPETRVVMRPQRVVVPAAESRALATEVERLRRELAQRDEQIRTQREELERIRKTLAPRPE